MLRLTAVVCVTVTTVLFSPAAQADSSVRPSTTSGPLAAMGVDTVKLSSLSRGAGQVVAVIDTGVQASVPDLAGALSANSRDFTGHGSPGDDMSRDSHGTSIAAVIAGRGQQKAGIVGVAPSASIMSVRIAADADDLDALTLAEGIYYATTHGADVINLSLAAERSTPQLNAAIARAQRAGIVVVAAAGNEGEQGNPAYFPARLPGVIAVGGSRAGDGPWPQSETGHDVDLAALAVGVPSLNASGAASAYAGTSYSAAVVSGTVALLRARYSDETASQIERRLASTARPLRRPVPNDIGGYGVVDPLAALSVAAPPEEGPSPFDVSHRRSVRPAALSHASRSNWTLLGLVGGLGVFIASAGVLTAIRRRRASS